MEQQDINNQIDLATRELNYTQDPKKRKIINKKILKLRLKKQIAVLQDRIDAIK